MPRKQAEAEAHDHLVAVHFIGADASVHIVHDGASIATSGTVSVDEATAAALVDSGLYAAGEAPEEAVS